MDEEEIEGLRERKKRQTRMRISRVALELFDKNGYQKTTLPQIAKAADVSPRTVSTYFPSKEEMVFEGWGERRQALDDALEGRPGDETTMDALRTWLLSDREVWETREGEMSRLRRVVDSHPDLRAYERSRFHEFEKQLAAGIAQDIGQDPGDLEPRMAASSLVAIFDVLNDERFQASESEPPSLTHQLHLLDQALAFVTAGVEAVRVGEDADSSPEVQAIGTDGV
ncbi:MAG: TetR family transcriptional regulator [Solirubrobacterales bacterium]|nr:TetR family transcriptional regulator [Solirubrobacterales bacterium]